MVSLYEAKMQLYRQQIEELESHLSALASDHAISPQSKYNCPVWYNYMYMWSVTPNRHYTLKIGDLDSILNKSTYMYIRTGGLRKSM